MILKNLGIALALFIFNTDIVAYDDEKGSQCKSNNEVYVFSWSLSNECDDKPRGGTSKGTDVTYDKNDHQGWLNIKQKGLNKFQKDRLAILAMQGPYRVDFNFLETVGFEAGYERDTPYHSWGTEYVYVIEDKDTFISLQHIMVIYMKKDDDSVSDPIVMKHWRQDWTYEDESLLTYQGYNSWRKKSVNKSDRKGKWSQAVFQVDDSPRYESIGQWQHNDSFSSWISAKTNRPLPRREYSIRKDYHILEGFNRHTINRYGWVQEEENWKKVINKDNQTPTYLSKEEGIGRYRRIINTDFKPGDDYLAKTGEFWKDVRLAWQAIIDDHEHFSLEKKVDGQALFMPLFTYASNIKSQDDYDSEKGKAFIKATLTKYLKK